MLDIPIIPLRIISGENLFNTPTVFRLNDAAQLFSCIK